MKQAELLTRVRAVRAQRDAKSRELNEVIRDALEANVPVRDIALAAGLSRQRIHQISQGDD